MGGRKLPVQREVVEYVRERLTSIQRKHNFDPNEKSAQIKGAPQLARAFGEFSAWVEFCRDFEIEMEIPFDPVGRGSSSATVKVGGDRPTSVYLLRRQGTSIWKVGNSHNVHVRGRTIQTGNDGTLEIVHEIRYPSKRDAVTVEETLKRYLRPAKTRDRNKGNKGEWFSLSPKDVRTIVLVLETHGLQPFRSVTVRKRPVGDLTKGF